MLQWGRQFRLDYSIFSMAYCFWVPAGCLGKYHMTHDIFLKGFSDWSLMHTVADVNNVCLVCLRLRDLSVPGIFNCSFFSREPPKQTLLYSSDHVSRIKLVASKYLGYDYQLGITSFFFSWGLQKRQIAIYFRITIGKLRHKCF